MIGATRLPFVVLLCGLPMNVVADRLIVVLNGKTVIENAQLPGVPARGPLALQHHGGKKKDGSWTPASSLVQFRNIYIKEL